MRESIANGLELTEEEAFALLNLAMTSPEKLDVTSERAIKKLASFCTSRIAVRASSHHYRPVVARELEEAG